LVRGRILGHGVDIPFAVNVFEHVGSFVDELDTTAGDEIPDC
jgi:hypothetical protein